MERVIVICIKKYFDIQKGKEIQKGTKFKVSKDRSQELIKANVCELVSIEKKQ